MPALFSKAQRNKHMERLELWIAHQMKQQPGLFNHLMGKLYQTGDILEVGKRKYSITVRYEERKTMGCQLQLGNITLKIPDDIPKVEVPYNMKLLLSKAVGNDFLPAITNRVEEINRAYFQQKIKLVRLRYNSSNWGSCSSSGAITLSTRLLFAPQVAIDYVIVHELAHMLVFDHSPAFWKEVKRVMPDYARQEKWLNDNYFNCDF